MTNLVKANYSTRYPNLYVRKYTNKVFYNNLWHTDPILLESRGHVYTTEGKLVVNPFTKIFNRNENGTDININESVIAIEKINGFMACLTWIPEVNDVVVSTTGSLDSDYANMARDMLPYAIEHVRNTKNKSTLVFEIVHPNDPHIIKENIGAYLLGERMLADTEPYTTSAYSEHKYDYLASTLRVSRPNWYLGSFSSVLTNAANCKHEGFMAYGITSGTVLKLKSPYYLTLKAIARKKDILSLDKKRVDEEYYPLLDHLTALGTSFSSLPEQERLTYIRNYLENPNEKTNQPI